MKLHFDTSVLVAAIVEAHPKHDRAFPWLKKAIEEQHKFSVATHTLAELYAVLTTLPVKPGISPGTAWRLVRESVEKYATVVSLSASDYRKVLSDAAELGCAGGAVYDSLAARAAVKAGAERLLTFNIADFKRVWPEGSHTLYEP